MNEEFDITSWMTQHCYVLLAIGILNTVTTRDVVPQQNDEHIDVFIANNDEDISINDGMNFISNGK